MRAKRGTGKILCPTGRSPSHHNCQPTAWGYKRCVDCGVLSKNIPPEVCFLAMVNVAGPVSEHRPDLGPCWIWQGAMFRNGYGEFFWNGKPGRAHRYSCEVAGKPIPDELDGDHLCRTRACVKPEHIEAVTRRENLRRSPLTPAGKGVLMRAGGNTPSE